MATMPLGVMMFPTDRTIEPVELARAVEERGFDSLWFPEHTHIPMSRKTPYPAGEPLPEEYFRTHDPFVALAMAAAVTTTLKLGTGICLVAQHDPIVLAKQVASIDRLSGGRFLFGIGYGWNVDEMEDHGVDPKQRRAVVREKVLAMRELWSNEESSFTGEHVRIPPSWMWPKPAQESGPPVLIGGAAGPTLFRHVVEYADGWMPIGGSGLTEKLPELRKLAEESGRDPDTVRVSVFGARPDPAVLGHYAELGVDRTILGVPPAPRDKVLPVLDRLAALL
jgi:probable F420-dependent oxidoreductase